MPARFIVRPGALGRIDTGPLLSHLAELVAEDMRPITPVDTGDMVSTVRVLSAGKSKRVAVGGIRGRVTGELVDYAHYVERGTSRMAAQPFMRPALYRYRSP